MKNSFKNQPMKTFIKKLFLLPALVLASLMATAQAQEVSIANPALNAAVRAALHKLDGPLTTQDMLSLTNLDAPGSSCLVVNSLGACQFSWTVNSFKGWRRLIIWSRSTSLTTT